MARVLTLNIGATKVTVAEYALSGKGGLTLNAYGTAAFEGLDLEAEGNAQAVLVPAVQEALATAGVKPGDVHLALGGPMIFPRFAKIPAVDGEKAEELLRYEVEQNVPFPIDEVVYDTQVTGETAEGDAATMIVAAKLDQVRAVVDAVASAGLEPVLVDAGPMAVYNALRAAYPDLAGCNVVLDIGAKATSLVLVEDEKIYLRTIPVAGNAITREIASAFGCTAEEAEGLKREVGYVSLGGVTEDPDETTDRVSKIIRAVLTRLHAEISRSINFYRSQQAGSAPSRIFLTGGSAVIPQIDEFFRNSLQVDVEFLNPFGDIGFGSAIDEEQLGTDAFTLAESVGLARHAAGTAVFDFDLLPPERVERAKNRKRIPFAAVGGALSLAALALAVVSQTNLKNVVTAETETVSNRAAQLRKADGVLKKAQAAFDAEFAASDAFRILLAERFDAVARLNAVRTSLLPGLWITSWEHAPEEVGKGVTRITVRGWRDDIAAALARYAAENGGKRTTVAEIVKDTLKGQPCLAGGAVKIAAQTDVASKGCLAEFALDVTFPAHAPLAVAADAKGKGGKKK